ncbi:major facilitator superfamily domain-containing protein [Roridomyces roridus]|uniref:Major facilitator superfamily domain-containing protein n=1 Tax=Roridomyces roridus TaxID=1738132 RepID=A0AAD7B673_9AGAR|nr:major facilitator superfamily domain-containing protein [Roridomyces roridus]
MDKIPSRSTTASLGPDAEKDVDSILDDPELEAKVWRKLDLWILPVVSIFYLFSFLDRTNIGNAKVAGLLTELHMTPKQYSIALTVTYVPYIVVELPANLLLKRIGPNVMLPSMITLWGVVTACQGTVKTYGGLLACRFFLGLLEGGVLPGIVLYLSFFYPRLRLQTRVATFFSTASLAGAFGGILAYGIIHLNGQHGHSGWQWIFNIEGVITVFLGLVSFLLLPASPDSVRFLNEEEKAYVKVKLVEDGVIEEKYDAFSWGEVVKGFISIHVLLASTLFFFGGALLYSLAYFTPSILTSLGYTASKAQLMSVPPFSVAFVFMMLTAYISDRYHCRGAVTVFGSVLCLVGFAMFLGSKNHHVQYGSLFLSIPGAYILPAAVSTWNANNAAPHVRRATAIAFGFIMTNSGGILSTWLLGGSLSPPPLYTKATKTLLAFSAFMGAFAVLNMVYLARENRKKAVVRADVSREQEEPGLGDRSAWFVYSL